MGSAVQRGGTCEPGRQAAGGTSTAAGGWLAQQSATPTNGSGERQELILQANGLEAKGAYGEAGRLWLQIFAVVEKALGPQHPSTAASLNNWLEGTSPGPTRPPPHPSRNA